jgi:hypothetical protein
VSGEVHIPRISSDDEKKSLWDGFPVVGKPCWSPVKQYGTDKPMKPLIRCNCGMWSGIKLHHVHADGKVTASFFHARKGEHPQGTDDGCGWHVHLWLDDYDQGEFQPGEE